MSAYRVPRLGLYEATETETEVLRSRFRCRVVRVEAEAAAQEVVEQARRTHRDARHHCSALVIGPTGPDRGVARSSDDGEPSGTAGAPMLEVLHGAGVRDVVVVVSRWFGGTLLGAGGLVRAYGDAVRAGLERAGTRERQLLHVLELAVDHGAAGRLESELRARGVRVLDVEYAAGVTMRIGVRVVDRERVHAVVAELTAGRVDVELVGERWVDG